MNEERRAELRRIAEAATPGPRHIQLRRDIADEYESWLMPLNLYLCEGLPDEDAAYIAAFDRETCLALLDAADRVAALEAEVKRLQSMTEHDMLKAWVNRMQEKQAHIQHPDGNTWCEWRCTACGKRIMWSNGDTNDLTGVDIDCVKCCHCGTIHDLRDDYEIKLRPEYRKEDAEETHPCIATLEAELAALKGAALARPSGEG